MISSYAFKRTEYLAINFWGSALVKSNNYRETTSNDPWISAHPTTVTKAIEETHYFTDGNE